MASRGAGQIILKITLPCLMFSKIVPAFSTSNIAALGPLFLVAFIYEAIGMVMAWAVKQFFWVPHRFRYGIYMAGTWANWADLPTAVVMSITAGPPFNGTDDSTIAVAYVSAFIFIFFVTLFPCGGSRFVAWDFVGPEVEDEERMEIARQKRQMIFKAFDRIIPNRLRKRTRWADDDEHASGENPGTPATMNEKPSPSPDEEAAISEPPSRVHSASITRNTSFAEDAATAVPSEPDPGRDIGYTPRYPEAPLSPTLSRPSSPTRVGTEVGDQGCNSAVHEKEKEVRFHTPTPPPRPTFGKQVLSAMRAFILGLLSPASLSVILAFPIALITPVKALFVELPNSPIPNAPDGQPPLAFIMDTASFVGAGSVPLGLICLGSALARLNVPLSAWKTRMPIGSIMSLAVLKIVVLPILGVLICQGLTHVGVIDVNDKVYLTQVYSGTGSADHISAFLIPQYILMIFSMTILTGYTINLLF
ncbi:hypothetical protein EIP86_007230 [Pleurotus ostreatoroseus]|nr:hypothetical protein EIP86_007230 [Pleurotus ostreatoroseus]